MMKINKISILFLISILLIVLSASSILGAYYSEGAIAIAMRNNILFQNYYNSMGVPYTSPYSTYPTTYYTNQQMPSYSNQYYPDPYYSQPSSNVGVYGDLQVEVYPDGTAPSTEGASDTGTSGSEGQESEWYDIVQQEIEQQEQEIKEHVFDYKPAFQKITFGQPNVNTGHKAAQIAYIVVMLVVIVVLIVAIVFLVSKYLFRG